MPFRQRLDDQITPKDLSWKEASAADRRAFFEHAGELCLERLKVQLSRGIGASGRRMKPRIKAVLAPGIDGPVMIPRYLASRAITLSDYSATDRSLLMWWHAGTGHKSFRAARAARRAKKKGGKSPKPFGDILALHSEGLVPHAPVRDVRLSRASIHQIRLEMAKWWKLRMANRRRGERGGMRARRPAPPATTPPPVTPPRLPAVPPWAAQGRLPQRPQAPRIGP